MNFNTVWNWAQGGDETLDEFDLSDLRVTDADLLENFSYPLPDLYDEEEATEELNRNLLAVRTLILDNCPITISSLRRFNFMKEVQGLQIADTAIDEKGIAELANLFPALKCLSIGGRVITLTDVVLKSMQKLEYLSELTLWNIELTVEGLKNLIGVKGLKNLSSDRAIPKEVLLSDELQDLWSHLSQFKAMRDGSEGGDNLDNLERRYPKLEVYYF